MATTFDNKNTESLILMLQYLVELLDNQLHGGSFNMEEKEVKILRNKVIASIENLQE